MKILFLVIILNLCIWLIAYAFGVNRCLFNIDYLLFFYLIYLNYKKVAIGIIYIILVVEFLLLFSQVFPFFRMQDLLYISKFIFLSAEVYIYSFIIGNFLVILLCYYLSKLNISKSSILLVFFIFSIVYIFSTFISYPFPKIQNKLIFSSLLKFYEKQSNTFKDALDMEVQTLTVGNARGVTKPLFAEIRDGQVLSNKILLIINESLGKPKNSEVLEDILSPLVKQKNKLIDWDQGAYPYQGATVYGELRDLCRASPANLNIKAIPSGFEHCLPNELKKFGFKSVGIHGALGIMYDRNQWYPKVGFDESIFRENRNFKTRCYSFPGVCDREFISTIAHKFKQEKMFVYWLTLNTHVNYDIRDVYIDTFHCSKYLIPEGSQSCRNFKLQKQFFYYLSVLLDKQSMKGVQVYLSGDHTPPIHNLDEKKQFFDEDKIMWLHFKVKE